MTLYARADVMHVSVPVTSGGCGLPHSRPVVAGAPAKEWGLTCPQCETFLKQDIERSGAKKVRTVNSDNGLKLAERYLGMWGSRREMVPETYDEEIERTFAEQETAKHQAQNQSDSFKTISDAIAMLAAQGQGNTALVQALAQALTVKQAEPVPDGLVKIETPIPAQPISAEEAARTEPRIWQYPVGANLPAELPPGDYRCQDCGQIRRRTSNKGPLPRRCPDCKAKKAA